MSYYPNVYAAQNGPLLLSGLDANFNFAVDIQSQSLYAAAGGSADVITATYTPIVTALVSGLTLYVKAAYANVTTTPTFSPNGLTAQTIKKANNQALAAGDITGAGHILILQYDAANTVWVLANPQGLTFASDLNVYGLTIGRGAGAVASNTAVGVSALINSTGNKNTAVGYASGSNNSTGTDNTGVGYSAMSGITGSRNTVLGALAAANSAATNDLTGVGYNALLNTTGSNNTAIGSSSGNAITTGSNNVILGSYSGSAAPISATGSNWIVLSDGAGNVRQAIDSAGNSQFFTGAVVVYAPTPATFSALATLTNANLQTQILVTSGLGYTLTMPTGTTLDTLISWSGVDLGFDFSLINTASGTITMAVNTGVTFVGGLTALTGTSARFRIRRTAASTYVVYRIS